MVLCDKGDTLRNSRWSDGGDGFFVVDVTKRVVKKERHWATAQWGWHNLTRILYHKRILYVRKKYVSFPVANFL